MPPQVPQVCRCTHRVVLAALMSLSCGLNSSHAEVTCATVGGDALSTAAEQFIDVLESQLSEDRRIALLNRRDVEKILAERSLSLAFGSEDRASLRRWGNILQADVLIHFEGRDKDAAKTVDVTIFETRHGLRLAREMFVLDDKIEAKADLLASRVAQCVDLVSSGIRHVFAVPPFEPLDLVHEFDDLRWVYARLAEQTLRAIPGAVVVEFEHADQIARELSLADGETPLKRSLPLYVIGRYRNTGLSSDRTVSIDIEIRRGKETVATESLPGLQPAQVAATLQNAIGRTMEDAVGIAASHIPDQDNLLEADLLTERFRWFVTHGYFKDAIRTAEACFLIDPARPQLHLWVFKVYQRKALEARGSPRRSREYWLQAGQQLRTWAALGQVDYKFCAALRSLWTPRRFVRRPYNWRADPLNLILLERAIDELRLGITLYVIETQTLQQRDTWNGFCSIGSVMFSEASYLSTNEQLERIVRVLVALGTLDDVGLQWSLASRTIRVAESHPESYERMLTRLEVSSQDASRIVAAYLRILLAAQTPEDEGPTELAFEELLKDAGGDQEMNRRVRNSFERALKARLNRLTGKSRKSTAIDARTTPANNAANIEFRPIDFSMRPGDRHRVTRSWEWFGCADGSDLLYDAGWKSGDVYLMRQAGELEHVAHFKGHIRDVVSDGRDIWVSVTTDDPFIQVLDGTTRRLLATFNETDGLPPTDKGCVLAAVAPGRVLAFGFFGRSWVASVSLHPDKESGAVGKNVDVFHEARKLGWNVLQKALPEDPRRPLDADFALTVRDPHDGRAYAVAAKHIVALGPGMLLVNAESREVWSMRNDIFFPFAPVPAGDRLLFVAHVTAPERSLFMTPAEVESVGKWRGFVLGVIECRPPDFEPVSLGLVGEPMSSGGGNFQIYDEGFIHKAGKYWTTIDVRESRARLVRKVRLPKEWHYARILKSNSYGLVALNRTGAAQVRFSDSASDGG